jgi:hypothetical protein
VRENTRFKGETSRNVDNGRWRVRRTCKDLVLCLQFDARNVQMTPNEKSMKTGHKKREREREREESAFGTNKKPEVPSEMRDQCESRGSNNLGYIKTE